MSNPSPLLPVSHAGLPSAVRLPGRAPGIQRPEVYNILCLLIFCLIFGDRVRADYPIEVIDLRFRPLHEILPVIRPFVGTDGTATGMGSQLIIKASAERLREIRDLLYQLDRPPRRLMIVVSHLGDDAHSAAGISASAKVRAGDGQISIDSPGKSGEITGAHINIYHRDRNRTQTSRQQIQALEGRPAFIESGEQIPVHERQAYYLHGIPYTRHSTYLQDVTRGFYAVPRLRGDLVTLEILQHADMRRPASVGVDIQRAGTTITGRLGEWIELAGMDMASTESSGGIARSSHTRDRRMQTIRLKVECLDCQRTGLE